jgi:hypothetical protein
MNATTDSRSLAALTDVGKPLLLTSRVRTYG